MLDIDLGYLNEKNFPEYFMAYNLNKKISGVLQKKVILNR